MSSDVEMRRVWVVGKGSAVEDTSCGADGRWRSLVSLLCLARPPHCRGIALGFSG